MKKFEEAKIEVLKFDVEDIVTESTGNSSHEHCTGEEWE